MDVNEEIVKEYLEIVEGCLVRSNIEYTSYHNSIDLLAVNKKGEIYDIEVKWKGSGIKIEDSDKKQNGFRYIVNQLINEQRDKVIEGLLNKKPTKKIFVTTKQFLTEYKREEWIKRFHDNNVEVIFFDDIILKLLNKINKTGKYDSPVTQTIRMLKFFNVVK